GGCAGSGSWRVGLGRSDRACVVQVSTVHRSRNFPVPLRDSWRDGWHRNVRHDNSDLTTKFFNRGTSLRLSTTPIGCGQDNVRLYVRQTYAYPSELISRVSGSVYVHGSIKASLPVSGGF